MTRKAKRRHGLKAYAALGVEAEDYLEPEGCTYSDRRLTRGFPLAPFGWSGTRRLFP